MFGDLCCRFEDEDGLSCLGSSLLALAVLRLAKSNILKRVTLAAYLLPAVIVDGEGETRRGRDIIIIDLPPDSKRN